MTPSWTAGALSASFIFFFGGGVGSFDMKRKVASDDRTSGNRAITEEMRANPRLSGQVDPMSDAYGL